MTLPPAPRAVLFDLDGTLADTAPDLAAAVNWLRTERGLDPTPYSRAAPDRLGRRARHDRRRLRPGAGRRRLRRPCACSGSTATSRNMAVHSTLFDGIRTCWTASTASGMAWGVVTNKPALHRSADPADRPGARRLHRLRRHHRRTPSPTRPRCWKARAAWTSRRSTCWYVGDDLRDIEAGRAAGMVTVACNWGYCGAIDPATWGADYLLETPQHLLRTLNELAEAGRAAAVAA
jgi:phosphoglycolate phosphatase-like HAD superfamily hydrolase